MLSTQGVLGLLLKAYFYERIAEYYVACCNGQNDYILQALCSAYLWLSIKAFEQAFSFNRILLQKGEKDIFSKDNVNALQAGRYFTSWQNALQDLQFPTSVMKSLATVDLKKKINELSLMISSTDTKPSLSCNSLMSSHRTPQNNTNNQDQKSAPTLRSTN